MRTETKKNFPYSNTYDNGLWPFWVGLPQHLRHLAHNNDALIAAEHVVHAAIRVGDGLAHLVAARLHVPSQRIHVGRHDLAYAWIPAFQLQSLRRAVQENST